MPTVMIRKSILDKNNLRFNNQLKYLIDWDLWLNLSIFGDFYYITLSTVKYRIHSTNEFCLKWFKII